VRRKKEPESPYFFTLPTSHIHKMQQAPAAAQQQSNIYALLADAIENLEVNFDLKPLFDACVRNENLSRFNSDLWAFHHTCREVLQSPIQVEGEIVSGSVMTFLLATLSEPIIENDLRSFEDFPLVVFHPKWTHSEVSQVPIIHQSQQVIIDALFGLDWLLFCDLFVDETKTEDRLKQGKEMFKLLKNRICFMIHQESLSESILDVDDYSTKEKQNLYSRPDTSMYDYDSDDENFKKARLIAPQQDDKEDTVVNIAHVNVDFIYDMEIFISHFHTQFAEYDNLILSPIPFPLPSLSVFRKKLFEAIAVIQEPFLIKERILWQQTLETHKAHQEVYKHKYGITLKPKPRQLIVTKNDDLVMKSMVRSLKDIITRDIKDERVKIRLSTDSMFWVWSMQNGGELAKLKDKYIYRDRTRGKWITRFNGANYATPSFTHAFFALRKLSGPTATLDNGLRIDAFDPMMSG